MIWECIACIMEVFPMQLDFVFKKEIRWAINLSPHRRITWIKRKKSNSSMSWNCNKNTNYNEKNGRNSINNRKKKGCCNRSSSSNWSLSRNRNIKCKEKTSSSWINSRKKNGYRREKIRRNGNKIIALRRLNSILIVIEQFAPSLKMHLNEYIAAHAPALSNAL